MNNSRANLVAFYRFILVYIPNRPWAGVKVGREAIKIATIRIEVSLLLIETLLASSSFLSKVRL